MKKTAEILVLGGGYAGTAAALRLAAQTRGRAAITLVDASPTFTQRVRLHQLGAGQPVEAPAFEELLDGTGIAFRRGRVTAIDPEARRVVTDGGELRYDRLVIALGSRIDRSTPGADAHATALHGAATVRDTAATIARIASQPQARVAVVGGGLTAIELAAELRDAHPGLGIDLVASRVAAGVSPSAEAYIRRGLGAMDVAIHEQTVAAVEPGVLRLGSGAALPFRHCVWAAGFVAPDLARAAGLDVNARGQVRLDATLRACSHPDLYVAGDAGTLAESTGAPHLMSCRLGIPMALRVADNLAAELDGRSPRPWVVHDSLRCISLGRRDGVIQVFRGSGAVMRWFLTGRIAATIKERVVWSTMATLRLLRWRARGPWAGGGRRLAIAAGEPR